MGKKRVTSSKARRTVLAADQHVPVREFLDSDSLRTELLEGLAEGKELTLLKELLEKKRPISSRYMKEEHDISKTAVSEAADNLDQYLRDFSKKLELLRAKRIAICIPREKGGLHVGYHFACFNTKIRKYLSGPATKTLFENIWKNEIEARLRNNLEEEAWAALLEKLKGRDDYQPLDMRIRMTYKEQLKRWSEETPRSSSTKKRDHNRVWDLFDSDSLPRAEGCYLLSSDVGMGKTTFLRHLQLELLQKTNYIPVFLAASEIEHWKVEQMNLFAEDLTEHLNLKLDKDKVVTFLEKAFDEKNIVLIIDGLDQIKSGADQHEPLVTRVIKLARGNVIIASRPSAVTALEDKQDIIFLELRPFSIEIQELYFGEHYKRACQLSAHAPDLVAIPMLAYMVRTLIEKGEDKDVKNCAQLYGRFISYILTEYRHGRSKIPVGLRNEIRVNLQKLSYDALDEQEPFIQKISIAYYAKKYLQRQLSIEVEELTKSGLANLIVERTAGAGDFLCFTHTSFQEYLAAEWVTQNKKQIKHILEQMWNPKWRQVIKFLAGLLGEEFIGRIYPPECKDNAIHSRLFLAAHCCEEIGKVTSVKLQLFEELKRLVEVSPFEFPAFASLHNLNTRGALDVVVELLPRFSWYARRRSGAVVSELTELIKSISLRLEAEQVDRIVKLFPDVCVFYYHDVMYLLRKQSEKLLPEHMDKIIDVAIVADISGQPLSLDELTASDEHWSWEGVSQLLAESKLTDKALSRCSERLYGLLESLRRLEQLFGLYLVHSSGNMINITARHIDSIFGLLETSEDFKDQARWALEAICSKLTPKHIDMLFGYFKTSDRELIGRASRILAELAGTDRLSSDYLKRLCRCFETNDIPSKAVERLLGCTLNEKQRSRLLRLPGRGDLKTQNIRLTHVEDDLSTGDPNALGVLRDCIHYPDVDLQYRSFDILCNSVDSVPREALESSFDINSSVRLLGGLKKWPDNIGELHKWLNDNGVNDLIEGLAHVECRLEESPLPGPLTSSQIEKVVALACNGNTYAQINALRILDSQPKEDLMPHTAKLISLLNCTKYEVLNELSSILSQLPVLPDVEVFQLVSYLKEMDYKSARFSVAFQLRGQLAHKVYWSRIITWLDDRNIEVQRKGCLMLASVAQHLDNESLAKLIDKLIRHHDIENLLGIADIIDLLPGCYGKLLNCLGNADMDIDHVGADRLFQRLYRGKPAGLRSVDQVEIEQTVNHFKCSDKDTQIRLALYVSLVSESMDQNQFRSFLEMYFNSKALSSTIEHVAHTIPDNMWLKQIAFLLDLLKSPNEEVRASVIVVLNSCYSKLDLQQINQIISVLKDSSDAISTAAYGLLQKVYAIGKLAV